MDLFAEGGFGYAGPDEVLDGGEECYGLGFGGAEGGGAGGFCFGR